jgi:hypothetical protein
MLYKFEFLRNNYLNKPIYAIFILHMRVYCKLYLVRKDLLGTGNYQFSVDTFFTDSVFLATGCLSMACVILAAVLIQKLAIWSR